MTLQSCLRELEDYHRRDIQVQLAEVNEAICRWLDVNLTVDEVRRYEEAIDHGDAAFCTVVERRIPHELIDRLNRRLRLKGDWLMGTLRKRLELLETAERELHDARTHWGDFWSALRRVYGDRQPDTSDELRALDEIDPSIELENFGRRKNEQH